MKKIIFIACCLALQSCIPLSIKPNIKDYKTTNGAKFKKGLPNQTVFVFEDPKDADEFYTYINVKFNQGHKDVGYNVPIDIEDKTYFMTFYETERATNTINLIPIVADLTLAQATHGEPGSLQDLYTSRSGQWYLVITVNDVHLKDALDETKPDSKKLLNFLSEMKHEYLTTANYQEIYFRNPPQ